MKDKAQQGRNDAAFNVVVATLILGLGLAFWTARMWAMASIFKAAGL